MDRVTLWELKTPGLITLAFQFWMEGVRGEGIAINLIKSSSSVEYTGKNP